MPENLSFLSENMYLQLYENVEDNLPRYEAGTFSDLLAQPNATRPTNIVFDKKLLQKLNVPHRAISRFDGKNSFRVYQALALLPRDIATFDRLWIKLAHDELLQYARVRWLSGKKTRDQKIQDIQTHLFGKGRSGYRDDNAVSRLWWTGKIVCSFYQQSNLSKVAECRKVCTVFDSAQRRQSTIERPGLFVEPPVAQSILRYVESVNPNDDLRDFMVRLNRAASGLALTSLNQSEADSFMKKI